MADSIESKAIRSYALVEELSNVIEVPAAQLILLTHASHDMDEIQQNEKRILNLIDNSTLDGRFLQASVLSKSLEEIDTKLSHLEHFFRTIRISGSVVTLMLAGNFSESELEGSGRIRQFLRNMESQVRRLSKTSIEGITEGEARIAFAMGLTVCGDRVSKSKNAFKPLNTDDFARAAQFFRKACRLGVKEAYRYLGDLYYEGHGVDNCYRTAVQL